MSELQAALLFIGFGVIVAVYALGWWQQRKYRRKFGAAFKADHADALYRPPPEPVMAEQDPVHELPVKDAVPIQLSVEVLDETARHGNEAQKNCAQDTSCSHDAAPGHYTMSANDPGQVAAYPASANNGALENEAEGRNPEKLHIQFLTRDGDIPVAGMPGALVEGSCALLDVNSDFIIELHLSEPSPAAVLGGLWQRKFDFGKPVHVCGLKLNSLRWEKAMADSQALYSRFRIALQLVDRGGATGATKLADFRDLMLGVARHVNADTTVPDVNEAHRRAIELDSFCAEVDQLIGINLIPPGERLLAGAKISQAASRHGMALGADGAFHLLNAHGHSVVSLINQDNKPFQHHNLETSSTPGITLLLDVPCTEHPALQFDRMLGIAHQLARELQVNLVDDHRVLLSSSGLARIRAQIVEVEEKMRGNDMPAGGGKARRLFS